MRISLAGPVRGKGRPRFDSRSGRAYTPEKTRSAEAVLRIVAGESMAGRPPIQGPVRIEVAVTYPVAVSWSRKRRARALAGLELPTRRPDVDNVLKLVGDALNAVVFRDDAQIVDAHVSKRYGEQSRLDIEVHEIGGED